MLQMIFAWNLKFKPYILSQRVVNREIFEEIIAKKIKKLLKFRTFRRSYEVEAIYQDVLTWLQKNLYLV